MQKAKAKDTAQETKHYTNSSVDTDRFMVALEQTRGIFSRVYCYFTQMYSLLLKFFSSFFQFFTTKTIKNFFSAARSN